MIKQIFEKYGRVVDVSIPYRKGCGFLLMENVAQCRAAINAINGFQRITPDSQPLSVTFAKPKDSGPSKYNKRY